MSVKKEESGRRSIQVEVEVPGTPEEVWNAIATGPGVSAWFVPTEIEEREGGEIVSHFGPGFDSKAKMTVWNPPHMFAAEKSALGPNAPPLATEWHVEARAGGTCVVRVVHSLFASTDDWDNQLEAVESGWPSFFRILRIYLTHFRGQRSAIIQLMGVANKPRAEVWDIAKAALGLSASAVGNPWSPPPGTPPASGVVEQLGDAKNHFYALLRLNEPSPGTTSIILTDAGKSCYVHISHYLYGDSAAAVAETNKPLWQAWLNEQFPADTPAGSTCG